MVHVHAGWVCGKSSVDFPMLVLGVCDLSSVLTKWLVVGLLVKQKLPEWNSWMGSNARQRLFILLVGCRSSEKRPDCQIKRTLRYHWAFSISHTYIYSHTHFHSCTCWRTSVSMS